MRKFKLIAVSCGLVGTVLIGSIAFSSIQTERTLEDLRNKVVQHGQATPALTFAPAMLADLPSPVRRYFRFVFRGDVPAHTVVRLTAEGQFRRPGTNDFNATTAEQVIAIGKPALMFSATTPVFPGIWARAYDFFADGQMEMKAKVLSTFTVVDERETPALNRISLRRWLLEAPLYPQSMLPGGPVRWQALDENRARAIVSANGMAAAMVAHFDNKGRLTRMASEEDGDLTTPYHGSGEHVTRSDYRLVTNMMIPHQFKISRAAAGKVYPFFDARITSIQFNTK